MFVRPLLLAAVLAAPSAASADALTADDAARIAVAGNPQVRAARERYESALRQIDPAYAPQDPVVAWTEGGSPNGLFHPTTKSLGVSESIQFPGKAWLQGDEAHRTAEIARLAYEAAVRDAGAAAQSAFYQVLLDDALTDTAGEEMASLDRVRQVARVAYAANQVPQSDLIGAEFDLAAASQAYDAGVVAAENDRAALNLALGRSAREPLALAPDLPLTPLASEPDALVAAGLASRQELLEAALSERNAATALTLARMESLPDFSLSYAQNRYQTDTAAPAPGVRRDNTFSVGVSVPIFWWWRQRADAGSARRLLEAARADRRTAELQTEESIVALARSTRLAYRTAVLYRDSLLPLARQDFQVALIAYQARKVDYQALTSALQRIYNARISYLTAANRFLAGRVALVQAIGRAVPL